MAKVIFTQPQTKLDKINKQLTSSDSTQFHFGIAADGQLT